MQGQGETQLYMEAQRVLRSLLIGLDPETNEQLAEECAACRPIVKVALALGVEALEAKYWIDRWKVDAISEPQARSPSLRSKVAKTSSARAGEGWLSEEDIRLTGEFSKGMEFEEIAKLHERSRGAIVSRLVHLGLVSR